MDLSQRELAEAFGLTTRQVRNWEKDGLPHQAEGNRKLYPLREAIAWFRDREVAAALKGVDTSAMDEAKLRKLLADAESKELDLAVKRGDLVPLDEVGGLVRESLDAVDSVLRHAPSRFAPALAKTATVQLKEARRILRDVIESVRGAIRETEPEVSDVG